MPIRNRSVMGGTSIQATPEEQNNQRLQEAYINAATQKYLADTQSNSSRYGVDANIGMNRENLSAQRDIEGTFDARSKADFGMERMRGDNMVANTRAINEPAMEELGLKRSQWDEGKDLRGAQSAAERAKLGLTTQKAGIQGRLLGGIDQQIAAALEAQKAAGAAGPAQGGIFRPSDIRNLARGMLDMGEDTSAAPIQEFIMEQAKNDPNPANQAAYINAARQAQETGEVPVLPKRAPKPLASNDSLVQRLQSQAGSFAEKDAATFGWDPSMEDVELIAGLRDRLAQQLVEQNGVSPDQAMMEATSLVEEKVSPAASSAGTGWIKTLRQRLGSVK